MNILKLYKQLNQLGEQEKIEAKTCSAIGKSIMETVCAYANEPDLGGGYLLLGFKESNENSVTHYQVEGIYDPEKILEDLVSHCRTEFNRPIPIEAQQELIDGKTLI